MPSKHGLDHAPKAKKIQQEYTYATHLTKEHHDRVLKIQSKMPIKPSLAAIIADVIERGLKSLEKTTGGA